jgi:hypothetical protein
MLRLSEDEVMCLIKALVEHRAKLERMDPYPKQKMDIRPYRSLAQRLMKYRKERWMKRTQKPAKKPRSI